MIASIIGIILIIGGISLYRTFALYKVEKTFNVLEGKVPDFGSNKITYYLDNQKQNSVPLKGAYYITASCNGISYSWDYENWKLKLNNEKNLECSVYFTTMPTNFSEYITKLKEIETTDVIEYSHSATYQTTQLTDYRYIGSNPNNYVCLEDSECTEDNLYRIIGVIPTQKEINGTYENRVKLIKEKSDESSAWTMNSTNLNWETSTIYANLKTFYDSLEDKQKYLEESVWYMGSPITDQNAITPAQFYTQERGNSKGYGLSYLSVVSNVGIMYPSDYGFTMGNNYINSSLYTNRNTFLKSWLYQFENKAEWTISPDDGYWTSTMVYVVGIEGQCWASRVYINGSTIFGYHPTFYLKNQVQYKSGNGTKESPYKISLAE